MYCRKCGKFIDYEAEICLECQREFLALSEEQRAKEEQTEQKSNEPNAEQNQVIVAQPIQVTNTPVKEGRTDGLAKGIVSIALSFFTFVFFMLIITTDLSYEYAYSEVTSKFIFLLGFAIPSIILGIKSIKQFKNNKRLGRQRPIATFILGLIGLATSAEFLLYGLLCLTSIA